MDRDSVFDEGKREALKYKWLASEKAGRDLGEHAIHCWVRDHWWVFLRAKWVEHLQGVRFWTELDHDDYGLMEREFRDCAPLLHEIFERLKAGEENLHVILWARDTELCMSDVLRILERLDINSRRLACHFAAGMC